MNALLVSVIVIQSVLSSTDGERNWTADYGRALRIARDTDRPLLVVLEDPRRPAGRLQHLRSAFNHDCDYLLRSYQLCRIDVSTAYGKQVAAAYGASKFPYTVITDRRCKRVVYRRAGQFTLDGWNATLISFRAGRERPRTLAHRRKLHIFEHPDLESATRAADRNNRSVLVFVTMPGCTYCEKMKAETFAAVQAEIARRYESVIVDLQHDPGFVKGQSISMYPTTLVMNSRGRVLDRIDGFASASQLQSRMGNLGMMLGLLF
jgi:hypothetical protein